MTQLSVSPAFGLEEYWKLQVLFSIWNNRLPETTHFTVHRNNSFYGERSRG